VALYATVAAMATYLPQVSQTPENEALFTDLLTRASATVDEVLQGVDPALLVPVPASIEQITLELAVNMWRSMDRGGWSQTSGVDGEGAIQYTGVLTDKQMRLLRQVRLRLAGPPV
jgi:hypothetical protein